MGEKTKQQLLSELLELQKELEAKVKYHDQMIRRFQMLTVRQEPHLSLLESSI